MKCNRSLQLIIHSILLGISFSLYSQYSETGKKDWNNNFSTKEDFQKGLQDSLLVWQEQLVLHTDKSVVSPKDHLFFKAYVLTGPEQVRVSASDVLKVELLDEEGVLIESQYHKIVNGTSQGSIEIPRSMKDGNYYLRGYTRWMLNYGPQTFTKKKIAVRRARAAGSSKLKNLEHMVFYPEGGSLVAGLTHHVVVSLDNANVPHLPVMDSRGNVVAMINNYGKGLGTFIFEPVKGEHYFIKLDDERQIELPGVQETGYSLQVNNLNDDKAYVRIEASPELKDAAIFLKGEANGITYFNRKVTFDTRRIGQIEIPKADLPSGMLELRLQDPFDQVWASRPVYIDKKELQITVERQSVSEGNDALIFKVTDREGLPVKTTLSVSLGRPVEVEEVASLGSMGERTSRSQYYLNDLRVLSGDASNAYTRTNTSAMPDQILYDFQEGLEFYGQAYDLNNTLLTNTSVQVLATTSDNVITKETETNSDGLFKLSGLQIYGEATMVFRTAGDDTKSKLVKVIPYEYEIPPLHAGIEASIEKKGIARRSNQFLPKKPMKLFTSDAASERMIELDEITLVATKELQKTSPSLYDLEPTRVIYQNTEKPKTIPQLFLNIPGVQVLGLGGLNPSIFIPRAAGLGPLLWVIDGLPLSQNTNLVDIISLLSYSDVERIELLIGAEASMYGSRASGGVILIYTRSGSDNEYLDRKDAQVTFEGFHESVNFETYRESSTRKRKIFAETATTLYWDPALQTDENGEAIITLSTPLDEAVIRIEATTITEKGLRGSLKTIF